MGIIAHIDMDCFFCACEEKRNPELKGKPVIVGGTSERGVVSAANYEARAFGVYSATPLKKAKKLCPKGIFLAVDGKLYREESKRIMEAFYEIADDMQQVSVDEAYLALDNYSKNFPSLQEMAEHIQNTIKEKTSLTCSIGISESRIVSKIASDYKKPAGITIVNKMQNFLEPLPIEKIPGIGKVTKELYHSNDINTIGDLAKLDNFTVLELFGKQGIEYQKVALGLDRSGITHRDSVKSISREDTFLHDYYDPIILEKKLFELSRQVHNDLLSSFMTYRTVSIKLRYADFTTITRDITLRAPINSLEEIRKNTIELFRKAYNQKNPVRLLGVKLSNLDSDEEIQLTLRDYEKFA